MKRFVSILLVLTVLLFSSVTAAAADTGSGNTSGRIVISPDSTQSVKYASQILCDRLNTVFGGYTLTESGSAESGDIVVGYTFDMNGMKGGSYIIKSVNGYTAIGGNGTDGLINGVYEFLCRFCDYEVYEKDIIRYTDAEYLTLPDNIDISYQPFFEYRKVDTASSNDSEYAHANSLNSTYPFTPAQGGKIDFISWGGHTLTREFCAADEYYDEHPEYFALHDGKRVSDQLCLSNEDTFNIVMEEVLEVLRSKHDPTQDLQLVSITQADNNNYCECEKCAAVDNENGSHAGQVITFVNRIAQRVKDEGYKNVAIDTFAYQWSRNVPSKIKPLDNVVVRLCSIECCFAHTIDSGCSENAAFMKDLAGWSEICDRLYIWDYVNNYSETFQPFPNFKVLQRNVQIFYENGAKGLYEEGNYYMDICDGEFYELRSYLLTKLMENPYREDYDELMLNYLNTVYGKGGKYLKEYIDATCDLAANHGKKTDQRMHIRQQPKDCLPGITNKQVKYFDSLWAKAKEEAETEEQYNRIDKSEISWEHWKCNRFKGEYTLLQSPVKYMQSHVNLLKKIEKHGNIAVGEGEIKYLRKNPFRVLFLRPTNWESKFDGKIYDKLDSLAKTIYELFGGEYDFEY